MNINIFFRWLIKGIVFTVLSVIVNLAFLGFFGVAALGLSSISEILSLGTLILSLPLIFTITGIIVEFTNRIIKI